MRKKSLWFFGIAAVLALAVFMGTGCAVDSDSGGSTGTEEPDGKLSLTTEFAGDVTVSGGTDTNTISKAGEGSLTLTAEGYDSPVWYVDGAETGTSGKSITLAAGDYEVRVHSVSFTGTKGGILYGKEIPFTVVE
ncbi:hypothetical protein Holit_03218 [Hollandina sp. SP2]